MPENTYAAGSNWFPWYAAAQTFLVTVSAGGVIHQFPRYNAAQAWEHPSLGFISDVPINRISFTLDNASVGLHDFLLNAGAGLGRGCPPPADSAGPTTSQVTLTPNPVALNTPVALAAVVDDSQTGGSNIASAEYSVASGPFTATAGGFNLSPTANVSATIPAFAGSGVYDLCVRGADSAGNVGQMACTPLPVYDPSGGFVTGGGWITSPAGAYTANPALSGKATFGLVSKYQPGANVPTGNTGFVFHAANLNFQSTAYDWLVVAGARAQYKGAGSMNGQPGYQFLLTAVDGDLLGGGQPDTFRLKIQTAGGGLIYDNQSGAPDSDDPTTALGGGSVVIHK